jgi:hypothetical protein
MSSEGVMTDTGIMELETAANIDARWLDALRAGMPFVANVPLKRGGVRYEVGQLMPSDFGGGRGDAVLLSRQDVWPKSIYDAARYQHQVDEWERDLVFPAQTNLARAEVAFTRAESEVAILEAQLKAAKKLVYGRRKDVDSAQAMLAAALDARP